jgi:hypothetical protein
MTDLHLSTTGPHSDDYTRQVARGLAETIRVLNHATRGGTGGLTEPTTAADVLGNLHSAVAGLDQLTRQIGQYLTLERIAGRLASDTGDVAKTLRAVNEGVAGTQDALGTLVRWLAHAHNAASHLYLRDGDPSGEDL